MLALFLSEHWQEVNDAAANEELGSIEEETVAGLKSMGCFGLQVPEELGGIGLTNTQVRLLRDSWREAGSPPCPSSPRHRDRATTEGWGHLSASHAEAAKSEERSLHSCRSLAPGPAAEGRKAGEGPTLYGCWEGKGGHRD